MTQDEFKALKGLEDRRVRIVFSDGQRVGCDARERNNRLG